MIPSQEPHYLYIHLIRIAMLILALLGVGLLLHLVDPPQLLASEQVIRIIDL